MATVTARSTGKFESTATAENAHLLHSGVAAAHIEQAGEGVDAGARESALKRALFDVVRAHGVSVIAERAGVRREVIYRALTPTTNPRFSTLVKLAHAVGLRFTLVE